MTPMKADCPTILRLVMVPDEAGDVVPAGAVVAEAVATVAVVAVGPARREVATPLPPTAIIPLKPGPILRLMVTQMTMRSSSMITYNRLMTTPVSTPTSLVTRMTTTAHPFFLTAA